MNGILLRIWLVAFIFVSTPLLSAPPNGLRIATEREVIKSIDLTKYFDANRLLMFVDNEGNIAYDKLATYSTNSGLYYPYTGLPVFPGAKTVVYSAGLFMGGKVNGQIRVATSDYSTEFVPGPMEGGTFLPDQPSFRVYKIDKNSGPGDPDYDEWPVSQGAPADEYGKPKLLGDQTLWSVFNDANPSQHHNNSGSTLPLGVEVQTTVWGSDVAGEQIVVYVKYKIYNRGTNPIDSFHISFWADPDLGNAGDDLVGCDTLSNIFYAYNAGADVVYASEVPVWGGKIVSGPVVPSVGDTALFDGVPMPGYRNLEMTSFNRYINGTDPATYQETFNYMKGKNGDGTPVVFPGTNIVTKFPYSGDPIGFYGWIDGPASDKRLMANCGPMTFNPGDSQQVIIKLMAYANADFETALRQIKSALDSAAVVVNPEPQPFVESDSVTISIDDYQRVLDFSFLSAYNQRWLSGMNWGGSFFGGSIGYGRDFFGSSLDPDVSPQFFHEVEVRFSRVTTQKAYRYLRGGSPNYQYAGYFEVPFTVWDTHDNRQLNAAFVENFTSFCNDNTWFPCDETGQAREYLFIMNSNYSGNDPNNNPIGYQNLNVSVDAMQFDILYAFWPTLRSGYDWSALSEGQVLFCTKQNMNPNGVAHRVFLKANQADNASQRLDVAAFSSQRSVIKFVLPAGSPFGVTPSISIFDNDSAFNTMARYYPPDFGIHSTVLKAVDVISGAEKAEVKLIGLPYYLPSLEVRVDPSQMPVYLAQAIDPLTATIHVGNFFDGTHIIDDVDLSSLVVNNSIVPLSSSIVTNYQQVSGEVLEATIPISGFIEGYGLIRGVAFRPFTVSGRFSDGSTYSSTGEVILRGLLRGDMNVDGVVNITDVTQIISDIFVGGATKEDLLNGDVNCDESMNISDVVYLIRYIFANGPTPCN